VNASLSMPQTIANSAARVTAVIVHWVDADSTARAVASVLAADPGVKVLVVDNASIDGSGGLLAQHFDGSAQVQVVRSPDNGGFGSGCNLGIDLALADAKLDFVLLLNPDCELDAAAIGHLCATARQTGAGIVGGRLFDGDGSKVQFENGRFRPYSLSRSHVPAPAGATVFRTEFITGALMCIDAKLLREGLRFDPSFFLYVEDVDLCREAVARGRELWIDLRATARHREGGSQRGEPGVLLGLRAKQLEHLARGKVYLARKRLPWWPRTVFLLSAFLVRPVVAFLLSGRLAASAAWLRGARAGLHLAPRGPLSSSVVRPTIRTNPSTMDPIDAFLSGTRIGVVGASRNPEKYGNRVLVALLAHGYDAIPVNPREPEIEGRSSVASVADLPDGVDGLSVITPPTITEQVVEAAAARGIRRVWMQPGADSAAAVARGRELGLEIIAGGPCILVALRSRGPGRPARR
jgi:GT2 family glycosyltransferase/predicted CoA-binding protein